MRYIFLVLLFPSVVLAQKSNVELENEIKALTTSLEVKNYWNELHKKDQSNRGINVDINIDLENFKKMVLLIKHHGYPTGFCKGCNKKSKDQNNFTPNIIFTHQRAALIREYFFSILYKAFKEEKANKFWFIHNLRGLMRSRFDRDFYTNREENIPKLLELMKPYLNEEVSFDIDMIDTLHQKHWEACDEITNAELIFTAKGKGFIYKVYKFKNKTYLQRVLKLDKTYHMPQQITYGEQSDSIKYTTPESEFKETTIGTRKFNKLKEILKKL